MNMKEIKEIAKQRGVVAGRLKKAELVRAVQQAENNDPCYATGIVEQCGQLDCLWRDDCK